MWKFSNFPATLILHETEDADFSGQKLPFLTILPALNFDFWKLFTLENAKSFQIQNSDMLKWSKWQFLGFKTTKIDFT